MSWGRPRWGDGSPRIPAYLCDLEMTVTGDPPAARFSIYETIVDPACSNASAASAMGSPITLATMTAAEALNTAAKWGSTQQTCRRRVIASSASTFHRGRVSAAWRNA